MILTHQEQNESFCSWIWTLSTILYWQVVYQCLVLLKDWPQLHKPSTHPQSLYIANHHALTGSLSKSIITERLTKITQTIYSSSIFVFPTFSSSAARTVFMHSSSASHLHISVHVRLFWWQLHHLEHLLTLQPHQTSWTMDAGAAGMADNRGCMLSFASLDHPSLNGSGNEGHTTKSSFQIAACMCACRMC